MTDFYDLSTQGYLYVDRTAYIRQVGSLVLYHAVKIDINTGSESNNSAQMIFLKTQGGYILVRIDDTADLGVVFLCQRCDNFSFLFQ